MEPKQTFIPKKPLTPKRISRGGKLGLFFGITFIILTITIVASAAVYFYGIFLKKKVNNMSISLERAKAAFEPSLIEELKRINARINSAESVLSKHVAFSYFFKLLEENTLKSIRFKEFTYSVNNDKDIEVSMRGVANSYSSIVLQADLFGNNERIKNPIFSNLGLDDVGNITFSLTTNIDPTLTIYNINKQEEIIPSS